MGKKCGPTPDLPEKYTIYLKEGGRETKRPRNPKRTGRHYSNKFGDIPAWVEHTERRGKSELNRRKGGKRWRKWD